MPRESCRDAALLNVAAAGADSFQVLSDDTAGELMSTVAGAVFTLTAHLSQSILSEQQQGVGLEASSGFASIANSALHLILRKLLDFILCTGR